MTLYVVESDDALYNIFGGFIQRHLFFENVKTEIMIDW